jgi:hypothetical protein
VDYSSALSQTSVYIHCLGLRALTYFKTSQWDILDKPNGPCTIHNFTLKKTLDSRHNLQAALIFTEDFRKAALAGFYDTRLMGTDLTDNNVRDLFMSVVGAQIAFQESAKRPEATPFDREHYRRERSNARRIAVRDCFLSKFMLRFCQKWLSMCFAAHSSGAEKLLKAIRTSGADLCSSEESDTEDQCMILRTKPLPWRGKTFEDFLSSLRQQNLYFTDGHTTQNREISESTRIPPTKVPIKWINKSWLKENPIAEEFVFDEFTYE